MAKTLIAFYSRRGENWVDGSVRFLAKGNNEVIVEKIKSLLPEELTALVKEHGQPAYRAGQLFSWMAAELVQRGLMMFG